MPHLDDRYEQPSLHVFTLLAPRVHLPGSPAKHPTCMAGMSSSRTLQHTSYPCSTPHLDGGYEQLPRGREQRQHVVVRQRDVLMGKALRRTIIQSILFSKEMDDDGQGYGPVAASVSVMSWWTGTVTRTATVQ